MHRRCERNRKRSKRRAIYCPTHECYRPSVSQKYSLFTNCTKPPQYIEASGQNTLMLVATETVVDRKREWLEAFWCDECQETKWYHVHKHDDSIYKVSVAPPKWQQAVRVINFEGNSSVSEFTRGQA